MSFDTTARQRVAPGAEKQDMPACLPLVSFLGNERAAMHYETKAGITVEYSHADSLSEPMLVIDSVPGIPGQHVYPAASLMTAAAHDREFIIGALSGGQVPFAISRDDVNAIARWAFLASDSKRGQFSIAWVPADTTCPF